MNRSSQKFDELIRATKIRLRKCSPFFSTLSLFAKIRFTKDISIAATDGYFILLNPETYFKLNIKERDAVFLHELMHMALLHPIRIGLREHEIFNIAADIVVNGMVSEQLAVKLPEGTIRNEKLEHLSVEEIYEILIKETNLPKILLLDLMPSCPKLEKDLRTKEYDLKSNLINRSSELENYWKRAIQHSISLSTVHTKGNLSKNLMRHFGEIADPQIDWKSTLWRYLVRTPTDFSDFDRRFIYAGIYLEKLESQSVQVLCCLDTSGSIERNELNKFIGELKGILSSYPGLKCNIWFADSECYGPYKVKALNDIPVPIGGGGTDFRPFFKVAQNPSNLVNHQETVLVYLTDGYGEFPKQMPRMPTLWVITPGGIETESIPFGQVCRLR